MTSEEECSHNCSACGKKCSSRSEGAEHDDFMAKANPDSHVKRVIAVMSGKGGVGKSLTASMLAVQASRRGFKCAVLDADITGPSIPRAFGLEGQSVSSSEQGGFPVSSKSGISVMSLNLLLKNSTDPVVWRGPMIAGAVKQFWTDIIWGDVDYMFIDMPPGTGDVPLTVFQSLPIDGVIIVSSPQELVGMIVEKAIKMVDMMNLPVLALVENMGYFRCPDCGKEHHIFGESHLEELARRFEIKNVCRLPIDPSLAKASDAGTVEGIELKEIADLTDALIKELPADA